MKRHDGKVAIVTGAGTGIGLATAHRLAREGACLVGIYLHPRPSDLAAELKQSGAPEAVAHAIDVADEQRLEAAVLDTIQRLGGIDVIVNNAAMMTFKSIAELRADDWRRVLEVNLLGAVHLTRLGLLHLRTGGAIINVSSVHAERTTADVAPYAASKAALLSLTRSAAIEGTTRGIRANAVVPGAIDTPMLWSNPNVSSGVEQIDRSVVGQPEDVAAAISFLACDEARFITGSVLRVDGGRLSTL